MLILTRRIGETLCIGEDIKVVVLGVNGAQVRIGIQAPRDVAVHRQEVAARIALKAGAGLPSALKDTGAAREQSTDAGPARAGGDAQMRPEALAGDPGADR